MSSSNTKRKSLAVPVPGNRIGRKSVDIEKAHLRRSKTFRKIERDIQDKSRSQSKKNKIVIASCQG
jgi:hypothetical protein